jgi:hypothetical protein
MLIVPAVEMRVETLAPPVLVTEIFWAAVEFERVRRPEVSLMVALPEELIPLTVETPLLATVIAPLLVTMPLTVAAPVQVMLT